MVKKFEPINLMEIDKNLLFKILEAVFKDPYRFQDFETAYDIFNSLIYNFSQPCFHYDYNIFVSFIGTVYGIKTNMQMVILEPSKSTHNVIKAGNELINQFASSYNLKQIWVYAHDKRIVKLTKMLNFELVATIPNDFFVSKTFVPTYVLLRKI